MAGVTSKIHINILPSTEQHLPQIIQIAEQTNINKWKFEDYQKEIQNPDSIILSAFFDSKVAGFLAARLISSESSVEIYNIAVSPKNQNKNIGTRLLDYLIKALKDKSKESIKTIFLEVRKSNSKAISFYEKNQFRAFGKRNNFYTHPTEDAVLMKRDL
jgi:ribosomal-protein-alanine N-acetyltransferase